MEKKTRKLFFIKFPYRILFELFSKNVPNSPKVFTLYFNFRSSLSSRTWNTHQTKPSIGMIHGMIPVFLSPKY